MMQGQNHIKSLGHVGIRTKTPRLTYGLATTLRKRGGKELG